MGFTLKSVAVSLVLVLLSLALRCVIAARDLTEVTYSESDAPQVPDAIKVPSGCKLHLMLSAEGEQYYRYNGTSWVNYSAKARLHNQEKKLIGKHFYLPQPDHLGGQPSWETLPSKGVPASLMTGVAVARTSVDEDSIPWVLLQATNHEGDKKYFGHVVYVQRINTSKGLAPSSTSGVHTGDVWRTSYTADYTFYVQK